MSHSASRDAHTQPNPYVSPLNALSNRSTNSNLAASSHHLLTNRLIPRDYLPSRTRPAPIVDALDSTPSPLTSETKTVSPPNSGPATREPLPFQREVPDLLPQKSSGVNQANGEGLVSRKLSGADEELDLVRIRSPESVETLASAESTAPGSTPPTDAGAKSSHNSMPRTSSIDSAISSVSASSIQQRGLSDARDPSPSSIRGLIATAGSAENLVLHLLKEKNHAASQNSQLWKLVEKQRALLLGLNKDLERVTKDRDRYKKKLKEFHSNGALPRAATQSPSQELLYSDGDNSVKPPEVPQCEEPSQQSTPRDANSPVDLPSLPTATATDSASQSTSSSRRPTLQAQTTGLAKPVFSLTEATPISEKSGKSSQSRKGPPKPLNLAHPSTESRPGLVSTADRAVPVDEDEDEPRGRRKTREDDDRDREKSLMKEQAARSKSKKQSIKPLDLTAHKTEPVQVPGLTLPTSPRPQGLAPSSTHLTSQTGSVQERLIALPLRSPGLPASPRPMNPNIAGAGSLPMSPRVAAMPLSPRAPKQPIPPPMMSPSPFADPAAIQRQNAMARAVAAAHAAQPRQAPDRLHLHEPTISNDVPAPYQGLVSSSYPNLLLPPNALPSIQVKVASSRLRPSRHSMLGLRTQEDSTIFSLSVYSRASRNELWRIEKVPASLSQLEQQLRPRCNDLPKLPDRRLFSGHNPAIVDTRRQALDTYFEDLLDMEIDEPSALILCRFLSEDVLDPAKEPPRQPGVNQESLPQNTSLTGKVVKTGFLTKRGKNFGGWKSRYFVLDSPELKYYETPGGPQIGTIKITYARIGTQRAEEPINSDQDDHYRHAFLIQEPKKKDSSSFVRHVLCAESDADRDQWVTALLHYVEEGAQKEAAQSPKSLLNSSGAAIRGPVHHNSITSERTHRSSDAQSNSPSPTSPASAADSSTTESFSKSGISAPVNVKPITDLHEWNNRSTAQQASRDKNSRVPNIFHFKKGSQEQLSQGTKQHEVSNKVKAPRQNGFARAVFGLPLSEAVEHCSPINIDVNLPAVVYRSIAYLRYRKAANEEGLFRLSGSNTVVKTLKERFNTEGDIDLIEEEEYHDVHAVASLFKQYLRELPSPLLTRDLHIEFLKVLELETQAEKVAAYNILVHQLPNVNFQLVRVMSEYLLEVTENASKNKMSVRNMGIVFSPTVNIPTPVFNLFLSEFNAIFEQDPQHQTGNSPIQKTELEIPNGLSPVDIRSPRHQMFSHIPTPSYNQNSFSEDQSASAQAGGHATAKSSEFGFTPLHPSYENGQYVTVSNEVPRTQVFAPPPDLPGQQPEHGGEQFTSLNQMMMPVPVNPATDKRRRRGSAMLL